MLSLGSLAFASPWLLVALTTLPVLWWLLKVTPPAPRRLRFPAIALLFDLKEQEQTPHKTPLWLVLLRMLLAALVILALARPLLNPSAQLSGSGPILRDALRAQQMLAEQFGIGSDVWSVTSYSELRREAMGCQHWNDLHPDETPRRSYLEQVLDGVSGPFISTSDNVRLVADQIREWVPGEYLILGTDGFGRSDFRYKLREHFEVNRHFIVLSALRALVRDKKFKPAKLKEAIARYGIDPGKPNRHNLL